MAWRKSSPELIAMFDRIIPADLKIERRKMFGYPAAFIGGNLFAGLHQENFILRLSESDRDVATAQYAAAPFEPMPGRPMREYIAAPEALLRDEKLLCDWVARSTRHASALPVKRKKTKTVARAVRKKPIRKRAARQAAR